MKKLQLTQNRLKELIDYNPDTGIFIWKPRPYYTRNGVGRIAGSLHSAGYITLFIDREQYFAHRLAWLYYYGEFPSSNIDHINRIKNDNRIVNLRLANQSQNLMNIVKHKDNTSGYKGVYWHKKAKKWAVECYIQGKKNYLGLFELL